MNKPAKIAMISMFKNESKSIGTMLESVAPYISYWVLQDNGSTDGTPEIVKAWVDKYKIPGLLYQVEEGWVGYGWNRDHVLQTLKKQDHGCDWIMKMDCDEVLEVEDDFDWSFFERDIPAFDVHAYNPGCQYFRTWIWNAKLDWSINHDPAHETIVLDGDNQNFKRERLDIKFKMKVGVVSGESYLSPTKYINDALKLEEKLIREGTMLQNLYHFWYIGKSYEDGYVCNELPLGRTHQQEMAKRCIFYFEEVLNVTHPGFKTTRKAVREDEMAYYAMDVMGTASKFLGEHHKAIEYFKEAEQFCTRKNDHLIHLAEIYWELMDYSKMLETTTRLVDPQRKNPFPDLCFLINPNSYVDTGKHPNYLHNQAKMLNQNVVAIGSIFRINKTPRKKLFVVDDFYDEPYKVREYALKQNFNGDLRFYKGKRTGERFSTPQIKQKFEQIMGEPITRWDTPAPEFGGSMNGVFQYCTPEDALVYHYDSQKWAAMIFLTPDAPVQTGTSFYQHKETGIRVAEDPDADRAFAGGFYDATKFELIDTVGNVFNRCVIFDARQIHAASEYFGKTIEDSRLFQIFFFD
jgi:glycosyltransferase involved in cell wall biosynthesis